MPPTKCVSLFLFRETACIRVYAVLTHEHSMQRDCMSLSHVSLILCVLIVTLSEFQTVLLSCPFVAQHAVGARWHMPT